MNLESCEQNVLQGQISAQAICRTGACLLCLCVEFVAGWYPYPTKCLDGLHVSMPQHEKRKSAWACLCSAIPTVSDYAKKGAGLHGGKQRWKRDCDPTQPLRPPSTNESLTCMAIFQLPPSASTSDCRYSGTRHSEVHVLTSHGKGMPHRGCAA
jgi:hypothetical protein